jgi:membrane protease YdiL (CAAX protease family)
MTLGRIIGAVLLVIGIVLVIFAMQAAESPVEQVSEALTGRFTERTMWYWILGIAGIVGGGLLLLFGKK